MQCGGAFLQLSDLQFRGTPFRIGLRLPGMLVLCLSRTPLGVPQVPRALHRRAIFPPPVPAVPPSPDLTAVRVVPPSPDLTAVRALTQVSSGAVPPPVLPLQLADRTFVLDLQCALRESPHRSIYAGGSISRLTLHR